VIEGTFQAHNNERRKVKKTNDSGAREGKPTPESVIVTKEAKTIGRESFFFVFFKNMVNFGGQERRKNAKKGCVANHRETQRFQRKNTSARKLM